MCIKITQKTQKRLREIEDRKINILLEIASIKDKNCTKISRLNSEFTQLHQEYYQLQIGLMRKKQKG